MKQFFMKLSAVVIAIWVAVWIIIKNALAASAAFVVPVAVEGVALILGAILVAAGVYTQSQVDSMNEASIIQAYQNSKTAIYEYAATGDLGEFLRDAGFDEQGSAIDVLNDYINKQIKMTSDGEIIGAGVLGTALQIAQIFTDWTDEHQSDVETVTISSGDSLDMQGYGAVVRYYVSATVNGTLLYTYYMYNYCDYVLIRDDNYCILYNFDKQERVYIYNSNNYGQYPYSKSSALSLKYSTLEDVQFYGDIRYPDGTQAEDLKTAVGEDEEVAADIGSVTIDGVDYPVAADGTVTIDGQTYPINNDGTVTITNNDGDTITYGPTYNINVYNDTAIIDLLDDLVGKIDGVIDDSPAEDVSEAVQTASDALSDSIFEDMTLPSSITSVFPFCIPFDFVRGVKLLAADPVAPYFEVPFEIPAIGDVFPGYSTTIVIDFSDYTEYFQIVRWGTFLLAAIGLCFVSFKIVKGV